MRKKKEEQTSSILKFLSPPPSAFHLSHTPSRSHPTLQQRRFFFIIQLFPLRLSKTNKRMSYKWTKKLPYSSPSSYSGCTVPQLHNPDTPVTRHFEQHHYLLNKWTDNASLSTSPLSFSFHNKTLPSYFFRHHYFPLFPLLFLLPFSYSLTFNALSLIHSRLASTNVTSITQQIILLPAVPLGCKIGPTLQGKNTVIEGVSEQCVGQSVWA
jgi:hypothetical protein